MDSFVTQCYSLFCFNLMDHIKTIYTHQLEKSKVVTAADTEKKKGGFGGPLDTPLKFTSPNF